MYGYKVSFEGFPNTVVACETKITNYSWNNSHLENMLEICITNTEYLERYFDGKEHIYKNVNALSCTVAEEGAHSKSLPQKEVGVTSVIVTFDKLYIEKKELNAEDARDNSVILLPGFTDDITSDKLIEFNILLHKYIHYNSEDTEQYKLMRYSVFYEIIAKLDAYVRRQILQNNEEIYRYNQYYIKKVNSIIQKKYSKRISCEEIAKEIGISSGYLSAMYKKATGITVSDYIIMTRMKKAEELLKDPNIPTSRIAAAVGYENECSFRKRFKRHFGMNVKEYRIIKHGNAMYHNKPTAQEE